MQSVMSELQADGLFLALVLSTTFLGFLGFAYLFHRLNRWLDPETQIIDWVYEASASQEDDHSLAAA